VCYTSPTPMRQQALIYRSLLRHVVVAARRVLAALAAVIALSGGLVWAQPSVAIDAPAQNSSAVPPFAISGWAVDLQAVSSTGIDSVAIYTGSMSARVAGNNVLEVSAVDVAGAFTGTSILLVGTPATFTVAARTTAGAPLPGAFVTVTDAASNLPAQYGTTGFDGNVVLRAPAGFLGAVTVQLADYHTFSAPVSGSSVTAFMSAKTENFQRGLAEWSLNYLQETSIRTHIEGISPWICRINCPANDMFASDTTDNDLLVGSWASPIPVTASRVFRFEPGSRTASIRYRFFSHVQAGSYRLTASNPANGQVLAEHVTNMASLQAYGRGCPGRC